MHDSKDRVVQYCAKEMQTKFAEISEITRISAIKLRTFASDEKAAKFRCFYCPNVGKISQARWLIETKFRCVISCPLDEISCFASTKRNFVSAKRNIVWTRQNFASTKRNFVFQEFVADYRITVIITSCKSTGTCKRNHYWKKKHHNDFYNCGEVLRQKGAFWLVTFFYFFLNIILF